MKGRFFRAGGQWIAGLAFTVTLASCGGGGGGDSGATRNFNTGTGFDSSVQSIATARDGSGDVYVGGGFTEFNGMFASRLVRLNRDGSRDTGFDVGTGLNTGVVTAIATIDDGTLDVYAGGAFTQFGGNASKRIVRLKPDGTEAADDFGFGFARIVYALALNEGKGDLYAGGEFDVFRSLTRHQIARIDNPGGTADAGFDTGSGFDEAVSASPQVRALAVARDGTGNIYAGGFFDTYRLNGRNGIVRITPQGANDGSFDPGSGFGPSQSVLALAIATDGSNRVYAGGNFSTYSGNARGGIARIMPTGADDGSFVTGAGFNSAVFALAVALDGSGDIYVGGSFDAYNVTQASRIARLNSDGSLDAGFATGSGFDGTVLAIAPAIDGSGDVFVGGGFTSYNGTSVGSIARLNSDGSLD